MQTTLPRNDTDGSVPAALRRASQPCSRCTDRSQLDRDAPHAIARWCASRRRQLIRYPGRGQRAVAVLPWGPSWPVIWSGRSEGALRSANWTDPLSEGPAHGCRRSPDDHPCRAEADRPGAPGPDGTDRRVHRSCAPGSVGGQPAAMAVRRRHRPREEGADRGVLQAGLDRVPGDPGEHGGPVGLVMDRIEGGGEGCSDCSGTARRITGPFGPRVNSASRCAGSSGSLHLWLESVHHPAVPAPGRPPTAWPLRATTDHPGG